MMAGMAGEAPTAKPAPGAITWDSHVYVDEVPDSLVRDDDKAANMDMRRRFEANCRRAQQEICAAIEELDGSKFQQDVWTREGGGGGISRVLSQGNVFEKAGCSLSVVYGSMPQEALASATSRGADRAAGYAPGERVPFFACGLSSVMHPRNPMAPTMHFNYRYFETEGGVWWFGGGTDITPSYLFEEDMKHFFGTFKGVCDKHDPEYYPRFKKWADEYFYIKHRGETRGLGGIFFDDQNDKVRSRPANQPAERQRAQERKMRELHARARTHSRPSHRPPNRCSAEARAVISESCWSRRSIVCPRPPSLARRTPRRSLPSRRSASTPSCRRTCRWSPSTRMTTTRPSRRSGSRCVVVATSSSTSSTTAAPSSG